MISKGKQEATAKLQQQQFNDLFILSNAQKASVQVEPQEVQKKIQPQEPPFRPITFPNSEEDKDSQNRYSSPPSSPSQQSHNANLILQSVDQKFPNHSPTVELTRPTRVAIPMAATTSAATELSSRFTDDQLDYVRDFAWTMFQVGLKIQSICSIQLTITILQGSKLPSSIGNLVLSPIQPQLQLSLLRTAAVGLTEEEIAHTIREVNSGITKDLIGNLRISNSLSTNIGVANAVFIKNNLKYVSMLMIDFSSFMINLTSFFVCLHFLG